MVKYDLRYVDSVSMNEMAESFNKDYLIKEDLSCIHLKNAIITAKGIRTGKDNALNIIGGGG